LHFRYNLQLDRLDLSDNGVYILMKCLSKIKVLFLKGNKITGEETKSLSGSLDSNTVVKDRQPS